MSRRVLIGLCALSLTIGIAGLATYQHVARVHARNEIAHRRALRNSSSAYRRSVGNALASTEVRIATKPTTPTATREGSEPSSDQGSELSAEQVAQVQPMLDSIAAIEDIAMNDGNIELADRAEQERQRLLAAVAGLQQPKP